MEKQTALPHTLPALCWDMTIRFKAGNIVEEPADVLVRSANIQLNLSGGVGSDLLAKYGKRVQDQLHAKIAARSPRCARQGELFVMCDDRLPYLAVIHAVACDPCYQTTEAVVAKLVRESLTQAAQLGARSVALTALGTGFGNFTLFGFGQILRRLPGEAFAPVDRVIVALDQPHRLDELEAGYRQPASASIS